MMLSSNIVARRASVAPAGRKATPALPKRSLVIRRFKEGEQADTSGQGSKAPKNPITGQRLEPVTDVQKEGYQAGQGVGQTEDTSARIMGQLGAQEGGRSFGEMQAFDGLGPEIINSRLSMLGFAIAAFWGIDVFQQVNKYPLFTIATFVIFTVASWIPFQQGQSYNVKSGPFTPALEVTLGRVAMIGFVGLILNEAYFGRPFVPHLF